MLLSNPSVTIMSTNKYKSSKYGVELKNSMNDIIGKRDTCISWYPGKDEHDSVHVNNNIQSNWDYRKFMTRNASRSIEHNHTRTNEFHDSLAEYPQQTDNRCDYIAGMVVGHSNGELGDMRSEFLYKKNKKESISAPFVNMAKLGLQGIKPFNW